MASYKNTQITPRLHRLCTMVLGAMLVVMFSGCVIQAPARPDDPYYAPVLNPSDYPNPATEGSLYSSNSAIALFTDNKAKRVGDIITVVLQESTSTTKSTNLDVKKESDQSVDADPTIFGVQPSLGNMSLGMNLVGEREFKGEAGAGQSNQLSGNISVTVVNIHPNGTLIIRGEKWMTLNRGDEFIRISGIIRPDDITPDNTIMSTKIANARITYSGTGELADSQQMGWLSRFFNSPLWPF